MKNTYLHLIFDCTCTHRIGLLEKRLASKDEGEVPCRRILLFPTDTIYLCTCQPLQEESWKQSSLERCMGGGGGGGASIVVSATILDILEEIRGHHVIRGTGGPILGETLTLREGQLILT